MALLFHIENRVVRPTEEILVISPFKEIWERDHSRAKERALKEFAYIEFIASMRSTNPFRQFPEDRKVEEVGKEIFGKARYKPDALILEGIERYRVFQTEASTTYTYYMAAKTAADRMSEFFSNLDPQAMDSKGKLRYKPKEITSALIDTGKVLENLKMLEKKVEEELFEQERTKAQKKISPFADPSSL